MLDLFSGEWTWGSALELAGVLSIVAGLSLMLISALHKINLLNKATIFLLIGALLFAVGVSLDTEAMITTATG